MTPEHSNNTHLILSWRSVGIASGLVALAALTVLTIVAQSDQTLSVVAIILAVIAFSVQIMVFIAQGLAANRQALEGQRLYGEMQQTLARIQERTQGTQQSLMGINERLLTAALGQALPQAEKAAAGGTQQFFTQVAQRTSERLRDESWAESLLEEEAGGDMESADWPERRPRETDADRSRTLRTSPAASEVNALVDQLSTLSPEARHRLALYAGDELQAVEGRTVLVEGFPRGAASDGELIGRGLLEPTGLVMSDGTPLFGLSDTGRELGRVFTADSTPHEAFWSLEDFDAARTMGRDT